MDVSDVRDPRWEAVLRRQEGGPPGFVYGVSTTGVYCRPSCPSRRPLRRNVRFFAAAEDARKEGFRPCRRCDPDAPHPRFRALALACAELLSRNPAEESGLADLAARLETSPRHLHRCFTRAFGVTPRAYARALRDERFRAELRTGAPVATATYAAGFASSHAAYAGADRGLGMTPGRFRQGGAGESLCYAIFRTALGLVGIAATARGIAWLMRGRSRSALASRLRDEFPSAELREDAQALTDYVNPLRAYLDGEAAWPELPIDVQATVFQARVLRALRDVPAGTRVSYAEVARAIGAPRAARAVAQACAHNPVPIAIPCHRVVRSDGADGGYALGAEIKRALLEIEQLYGENGSAAGFAPSSSGSGRRSRRTR